MTEPVKVDPLLKGIRIRALFDAVKENPESFVLEENRVDLEELVDAMRAQRAKQEAIDATGQKRTTSKTKDAPAKEVDLSFLEGPAKGGVKK